MQVKNLARFEPWNYMYSKTYLKQPLKNSQNKGIKDKW